MSSYIEYGTRMIDRANWRFASLLEWAIEVSAAIEHPQAAAFRERFQETYEGGFVAWHGWDIARYIESDEEAAFLARAFVLVSVQLAARTLGPTTMYPETRVALSRDAWTVAEMLAERASITLPPAEHVIPGLQPPPAGG